ncbi:ATP-dependent helicase [Limnochorda pilosa]|uniref:ATP-dependent DNA helicase PcrA n=1 Tax=Limnochorda pilosa TaxID=1555112 RepID=A0A0K2SND5_LIMPI|nr:UvrD-helicase domain-containing protein [Limnochorda pilosa]BAS28643.1 ATP-dependent DNA helicase PcrA [Limnochorda pilosa]
MTDWLKELNPRQREAVEHGDGPLLVVAGAGSGKTRVLTYRIAYLIEVRGVPAHAILAVTFTNKAANEMRQRIERLIGARAEQAWIGTFHATCVRMLRQSGRAIGLRPDFGIFDGSDQLVLVRRVMKELNIDSKRYEPRSILGAISAAKNETTAPEAYAERASDPWERQVAKVYRLYQQGLEEANALDFDDLLLQANRMLEESPEVLRRYQERFRHVLVDEYQDTNHAQYLLVNRLAAAHRNLCVVGDADQSIYGWRGADVRNILEFERDYPDARVVLMEQNYRSTARILESANHVIANNLDRPQKRLWTEHPEGDPVYVYQAVDERHEAAFVADAIELGHRRGRGYGEFTLLYRTHAQSRAFEEEFVRRGLPYRIVAGLRFYDRKEIKDLLGYLRVLANPRDRVSLERIVNVPRRGIGEGTLGRVEAFARTQVNELGQSMSLYEAMGQAGRVEGLSVQYRRRLAEFHALLEGLRAEAGRLTVTDLVGRVLQESGYLEALQAEFGPDAESRIQNLQEFLTVTQQFDDQEGGQPGKLSEFLEQVALVSDVDAYDSRSGSVTLMTLHAAKGLEFPVVFLVGLEEGVFPHSRAVWEPGEIEEERRLAYVGMTRAQQVLVLTCARQRTLYGSTGFNPMSRFIEEIPEHLRQDVTTQGARGLLPGGGRGRRRGGARWLRLCPEGTLPQARLRRPSGRASGCATATSAWAPWCEWSLRGATRR